MIYVYHYISLVSGNLVWQWTLMNGNETNSFINIVISFRLKIGVFDCYAGWIWMIYIYICTYILWMWFYAYNMNTTTLHQSKWAVIRWTMIARWNNHELISWEHNVYRISLFKFRYLHIEYIFEWVFTDIAGDDQFIPCILQWFSRRP